VTDCFYVITREVVPCRMSK